MKLPPSRVVVHALYVVQEMKHIPTITLVAVFLAIVGCASDANKSIPQTQAKVESNNKFGTWRNRYPSNSSIVGVWIQQLPDSDTNAEKYKYNHPCMVYYVFPNGISHGIHYHPDGTIEYDSWSESPEWMLEQLSIIYRPEVLQVLIARAKANKNSAQQAAPRNR